MDTNIAIYRPDDIPIGTFGWTVSFQPLIELLTQLGLEPTLAQRRLHPSWRDQDQLANAQVYDVVEIPQRQFVENQQRLKSLGFECWPEDDDAVSILYEAKNEL